MNEVQITRAMRGAVCSHDHSCVSAAQAKVDGDQLVGAEGSSDIEMC